MEQWITCQTIFTLLNWITYILYEYIWLVYIGVTQKGVDKYLAYHNQTIEILSIVGFTYYLLYLKQ